MAKKKEVKETKLEVNPKFEEQSIPENFVGAHTNESEVNTDDVKAENPTEESILQGFVDGAKGETFGLAEPEPGTETTQPIEEIIDKASLAKFMGETELKEPEFHDQESDVQENKRYHRQDVVHIAQVCAEALKAWKYVNGDSTYPGWEDSTEEKKSNTIYNVDKVLSGEVNHDADYGKEQTMCIAIINALK